MRILKFGGSSLANPASIRKVTEIIKQSAKTNEEITVVVSAQSGVTDKLAGICDSIHSGETNFDLQIRELEARNLDAVRELIPVDRQPYIIAEILALCNQLNEVIKGATMTGEITARTKDLILSFGEQLSAWLICNVLKVYITDTFYADARKFIKTDSSYGNAKVHFEQSIKLIKEYYERNKGLHIVTGFIACSVDGQTTTLGRNGSDYTASLLELPLMLIWLKSGATQTEL